jgi:hypothetical protein
MVLAKIGNFVQFSLYHTRQDFRGKKAKKKKSFLALTVKWRKV